MRQRLRRWRWRRTHRPFDWATDDPQLRLAAETHVRLVSRWPR